MNASATTSATSTSTTSTSTTGSTPAASSTRRRSNFARGVALVPVVAGVVAVAAAGAIGGMPAATAMALLVSVGAGVAAAVVDISMRRIPDRLVLVAATAVVTAIPAAVLHGHWSIIPAVVLGAVGFAGPVMVVHLAVPAAIGFGDVKLAAVLGAALGLHDPRLGLLALCAAAATTVVVGLVTRRPALPFGPGLVVGAIAAVATGPVVFP